MVPAYNDLLHVIAIFGEHLVVEILFNRHRATQKIVVSICLGICLRIVFITLLVPVFRDEIPVDVAVPAELINDRVCVIQ